MLFNNSKGTERTNICSDNYVICTHIILNTETIQHKNMGYNSAMTDWSVWPHFEFEYTCMMYQYTYTMVAVMLAVYLPDHGNDFTRAQLSHWT